ELKENAALENLEVIRSLKRIHDIYKNNPVRYQSPRPSSSTTFLYTDPDPKALDHYLKNTGPIELTAVQSVIKKKMDSAMFLLHGKYAEAINKQKEDREDSEKNILPQIEWRNLLDLPKEQRPETDIP